MSDYSKTTNFSAKDALPRGDANKRINGSLFDTEYDAISTAIATKYDSSDIASQAEAQDGVSNTKLMTPIRARESFNAMLDESNTWTTTQTIASTTPAFNLTETDAAADETRWQTRVAAKVWSLRLLLDDGTGARSALVINRGTGPAVDSIVYGNTTDNPDHTFRGPVTADDGLSVGGSDVVLETRTISAGTGISGGGDLSANRTITLDVGGLSTITAIDGDADFVCIRDESAGGARKVLVDNLIGDSQIGYRDIPQVTHNADYTFAIDDRGKMMYHTSGTAHAWTIPPNASVAFPIGTTIVLLLLDGSNDVTLTPDTGVTLRLAGTGVSGARTLSENALATLTKIATNSWYVSGAGIS